VLRPNGAIKAMRTEFADEHETFLDSQSVGFTLMPEERSVHVALEMDFQLVEMIMRKGGFSEMEKP
jgi:CMP-N-acetylneuraminic acid synthetase